MRVNVLGATEVWLDGRPVELGALKPRSLVAALALSGGRAVSPDTLADLVWGEQPPDGVAGTLQAYVSGLRRALEPGRAPRTPPTVLVTVPPGYALRLADDAVDAVRFAAQVNGVRRRLGRRAHAWDPVTSDPGDASALLAELDETLALWRGEPYLDLGDAPSAVAERTRLDELRMVALEDRAALGLAMGDHGTVAAELEALTTAHPVREQLWGLRAVALARAGRQAEALEVLGEVRRVLDEELGLEPSAPLQELQTALLRQDPDLVGSPARRAPVARATAPAPSAAGAAWPLVGRDAQLATLVGRLVEATGGTPAFAAVTGDPGIGKSRLCAELVAVAHEQGVRVVVGRCSQDDGAPPLWPWQQVLTTLGADLDAGVADEGAEFRTWEAIVRRVHDAARAEPLVVVLDDLHWADTASLRVLRLLLETVHDGRIMLLGTWRPHPEPTGALADVAEALARRHAARVSLTGLGVDDVARIVEAVAQVHASGAQAGALTSRTDGNPFFLVEYARLARESGDLAGLLDGADPPTAVGDVLSRRLDRLPDESRRVVAWAAVTGREFELEVLAEAAALSEDAVLDALDPALAAGLVREPRAGGFVFAHALVRDAAYAALGPTRQARAHAAVAAALDHRLGRATEAARHWLDAGPAHAARAWRAAEEAAAEARAVHAYEPAAGLLSSALDRLDDDPTSSDEDRYRLLMALADAHRWQGAWVPLGAVVHDALTVAQRIDDVRLVARAASNLALGAFWQTAGYAEVNTALVDALRVVLARLPDTDDELRCRAMLALGAELYYAAPLAERLELIEEALAMARRIGDEQLVVDALEVAFVACWTTATKELRLSWATEALATAERLGAERSFVTAATQRAVVLSELGRGPEMAEAISLVKEETDRLHLDFARLVVEALDLSWDAMRGDFGAAEAGFAAVEEIAGRVPIHNADYALAGALVSIRLWQDRRAEVLPLFEMLGPGPMPITSIYLLTMLREGLVDRAREAYSRLDVDLSRDDWYAPVNWAGAAEVAVGLGDAQLGATAYTLLEPYAGHAICAGSGLALGPVDAFLACAAAATGDRDAATRHADTAAALLREWDLPLCAGWFDGLRRTHNF